MSLTISPLANNGALWVPVIGTRTQAFVAKKTSGAGALSGPSMDVVLKEATDILAHCIPPAAASGSGSVLAVGYVQSGKTLSFTTVSALARDNGFGIVIVLAGTTNNLKDQSEERLEKDLGLENLQRDWRHFNNPEKAASYDDMKKTLANWDRYRKKLAAEEKPALLVTILKHAQRLNSAAVALGELELGDVPVLVIDDESDQAGLNTKARKNLLSGASDESGTYEAIVGLRKVLPHHSYLQYTATPQANLLLAATDTLNPSFAKVISSGPGYTGGQTFFQERRKELVVMVKDNEMFDPKAPFEEPPIGFQEALRVFLLGICEGAAEDGKSNRSMMVQAHQNTDPHKLYYSWTTSLLESWSDAAGNEGAAQELSEEFKRAYAELKKTVPAVSPLPVLLKRLQEKIAEVRVVIVNSTSDAEKKVKWKDWFYWILIGGQKLDRGFTVEGLTVTYMPRPVSDNADVLQQRARFFGYRSTYIDFCRVYLINDAIDAFSGYVADEEFLRASLREHEGQPLSAWKRDFILHKQITRPTRTNVMGRRAKRLPLKNGWTWPKSMHLDPRAAAINAAAFVGLQAQAGPYLVDATDLPGVVDKRSGPRNLVWRDVPLDTVSKFLIDLRYGTVEDSLLSTAMEMALGRWLHDHPKALATVVFMNELEARSGGGRQLSVLRSNIHVGMSPNGAEGELIQYSGDRSVVVDDQLTLQLRMISLASPKAPSGEDYSAVPWVSVHLPETIANDAWLELD